MSLTEEFRETFHVPGEWFCLGCQGRVSQRLDLRERPECPTRCGGICVPLTWKRYGPEQQSLLQGLRVMHGQAVQEAERIQARLLERESECGFLREQLARRTRVFWPALLSVLLAGLLLGVLGSLLIR